MIYQKNYFVKNPKATIIIVHGIAEHSLRYKEFAIKLNEENFDCITYDHLGHGKSSGKRGKLDSFHELIDVLNNIVIEERLRTKNKIFLLGHSMGGGVVNMYEAKYSNVDGIISMSAATNTPKGMKIFRFIPYKPFKWIKVSTKMFDDKLAYDPNVLKRNKEDELMLTHMYLSLLGEMFIKGVKFIHKNINNFKSPILYLHGSNDLIVDKKFSLDLYEKIPTKDKEIIIYEGELHELLNDYNKDKVIKDILNWLNNRV